MTFLPQFDDNLGKWIQAASWGATLVGIILTMAGLLLTVSKFRSDLKMARDQRDRDLRWKQAEAGKQLNDELLADAEVKAALHMVDFPGREFKLPSGR